MQKACNGSSADNYMIINTLEDNMQKCLIKNTIQIHEEEKIINSIIKKIVIKILYYMVEIVTTKRRIKNMNN